MLSNGGFPLGEMIVEFAATYIWACTLTLVYSSTGEICLFKIIFFPNKVQRSLSEFSFKVFVNFSKDAWVLSKVYFDGSDSLWEILKIFLCHHS